MESRLMKILEKQEGNISRLVDVVQKFKSKVDDLRNENVQLEQLVVWSYTSRNKITKRQTDRKKLIHDHLVVFMQHLQSSYFFCESRVLKACWGTFFKGTSVISYFKSSANSLSTMFFSRLPKELKTKFETTEGKEYTNFRQGIMLSGLRSAKQGRMTLFDEDSTENQNSINEFCARPETRSWSISSRNACKKMKKPD